MVLRRWLTWIWITLTAFSFIELRLAIIMTALLTEPGEVIIELIVVTGTGNNDQGSVRKRYLIQTPFCYQKVLVVHQNAALEPGNCYISYCLVLTLWSK